MGWPDPQRSGHGLHHRHLDGYTQCAGPYGPCCYPDSHHGWAAMCQDLADAFEVGTRTASHDPGHIPLRWRLLVHYRDTGTSLADVARLFGTTQQSVSQQYRRWKPRMCCPLDQEQAA